jgi:hypothetical protein
MEVVTACFKVKSLHFHRDTEKDHDISQPGVPIRQLPNTNEKCCRVNQVLHIEMIEAKAFRIFIRMYLI